MNKLFTALFAAAVIASPIAQAQPTTVAANATIQANQQDEAAIRQLLTDYAAALKAESPAAVAKLFTQNGIVMPPSAPTAIGEKAVQTNYLHTFNALSLDLTFDVVEMNVMGNTAVVRSTSSGSVGIKADKKTVNDHFRELWVMEKVKGEWKIARYMFNQDH